MTWSREALNVNPLGSMTLKHLCRWSLNTVSIKPPQTVSCGHLMLWDCKTIITTFYYTQMSLNHWIFSAQLCQTIKAQL